MVPIFVRFFDAAHVGPSRNAKFAEGELRHYVRTNAEKNKTKNAEHCLFFPGANYLKLKFTANDTRDFQRKNANFAAQYAAKKGSPFPCTPPKKHAHATARATAPGFCLAPTLRESDPPNCDTLFGDFFFKGRAFFLVSDFIRTQGSGKKRATGRENEASARRRRAAGAPKARRRRAGSALTPPKKNTFFGPGFLPNPNSDMSPPATFRQRDALSRRPLRAGWSRFFLRLFVDFHFSMILW